MCAPVKAYNICKINFMVVWTKFSSHIATSYSYPGCNWGSISRGVLSSDPGLSHHSTLSRGKANLITVTLRQGHHSSFLETGRNNPEKKITCDISVTVKIEKCQSSLSVKKCIADVTSFIKLCKQNPVTIQHVTFMCSLLVCVNWPIL